MIHSAYELADGREVIVFEQNGKLIVQCTRNLEDGEKYPKMPKKLKNPAGTYVKDGKAVSYLVLIPEAADCIAVGIVKVLDELETKGGGDESRI